METSLRAFQAASSAHSALASSPIFGTRSALGANGLLLMFAGFLGLFSFFDWQVS